MKVQFTHDGPDGLTPVSVEALGDRRYRVMIGEASVELDVLELGSGEYHVLDGYDAHDVLVLPGAEGRPSLVHCDGGATSVQLVDERQAARALLSASRTGGREADGAVAIRAPMPGKVVKSLVQAGDAVSAGQGIIVIEAMKMENELRTPVDGSIKEIRVVEGDNVEAGEPLVLVE